MTIERARDAQGKLIPTDAWPLKMFDMGGTSEADCLRGVADWLGEENDQGRRCHLISISRDSPWVDEDNGELSEECVSVIVRYCGPSCVCRSEP